MSPLKIFLSIIFVAVCLIVSVIIMRQESKQNGLSGALMGASASSENSYWAKNKGRSRTGKLVKWSRILIAIFLGLGLILNINGL